jgi:hypothetical protein
MVPLKEKPIHTQKFTHQIHFDAQAGDVPLTCWKQCPHPQRAKTQEQNQYQH